MTPLKKSTNSLNDSPSIIFRWSRAKHWSALSRIATCSRISSRRSKSEEKNPKKSKDLVTKGGLPPGAPSDPDEQPSVYILASKHMKHWRRAAKIRLIEEQNPSWQDLAENLS